MLSYFVSHLGVHLYQNMYGCEWDDETEEVKGYDNYGFDGEDLIAWELKTEIWVAPKQEATITKNKWNSDKALLASKKQYYGQMCPEWLKKYLDYGKNSLSRKGKIMYHCTETHWVPGYIGFV